jgi:hypothetical protein
VIIGTISPIICGIGQYLGHLTKEHHVGFEAASIDHFVHRTLGKYMLTIRYYAFGYKLISSFPIYACYICLLLDIMHLVTN